MTSRRKRDKESVEDVLSGNSLQSVADDIYGASALSLDSGRRVAKPIPIAEVWFDLTQPRNLIPARVRGRWDGDPGVMPSILEAWHSYVSKGLKADEKLSIARIIRGEAFIEIDKDEQPPAVRNLVELIELALNIQEHGLTNPITVSRRPGGGYLLHTGERRMLAHYMLRESWLKDDPARVEKWSKIPADIEDKHNVWSQLSENTQRAQMKAVEMARGLAKLIMAMYADEMEFAPEHEMRTADGCNRPYFAQVIDLNLSIKHGMGDKVQNALNIGSRSRLSHFRKILTLPDEIWTQADEEDWSEGKIRAWFDAQKPKPESKVFTTVNTLGGDNQFYDGPEGAIPEGTVRGNKVFIQGEWRYRTDQGARMGLHRPSSDTPHPPAPSPTSGEGEQALTPDPSPPGGGNTYTEWDEFTGYGIPDWVTNEDEREAWAEIPPEFRQGRPVLRWNSPKEWFDRYDYIQWEDRDDMEFNPSITWDELDEWQAHLAQSSDLDYQIENGELSYVPLAESLNFKPVVELLHTAAKVLDDPKAKKAMTHWLRRSPETIRLGLIHAGGIEAYREDVYSQWDDVLRVLNALHAEMQVYMEQQLSEGERIYQDQDGE